MTTPTNHACLDEALIEGYLLRTLNEFEVASLEEKILICEKCRELFTREENLVTGIRRVMSLLREQENKSVAKKATAH